MSAPTLTDLRARVEAAKKANMLQKAAAAELALDDLLKYLEQQEKRLGAIERLHSGQLFEGE
jgi:hypothetical protein